MMKLGCIAAALALASVESLVETSPGSAVVEQETRGLGDADPWADDGHPGTDDAWVPPLPPPPLPPVAWSSSSEDYYYYGGKGGKSGGGKGGKSGGGKGGKSNAYGYYYYDDDDDDDDHGPWYPPYRPRPYPHRPHRPVSRDDDWGPSGCTGKKCEGEHNHYHGHWIHLPRPISSSSSPSAKGGKTKGGKSGSKGGKSGSKGGKSNAYGYYYYDDDDDDDDHWYGRGYGYLGGGGYYGPGYGPGYYPGYGRDDDWGYPGRGDDDWSYPSTYPIRPHGPGYWVGGWSQPAYVSRSSYSGKSGKTKGGKTKGGKTA